MIEMKIMEIDAADNVSRGSLFNSVRSIGKTATNSTTACSRQTHLVTQVYTHETKSEVNIIFEKNSYQ